MISYALSAVHVINKFLWSELQTGLGWNTTTYNGLIPITGPGQEPEFNQIDAPYIVYNYTIQGLQDTMLKQEQIVYSIYSADESDIRSFINMITDLLDREDDSASDINLYVDSLGSSSPYHNFDIKWTRVTTSSGSSAPYQEGGRMDGVVVVRVCYTISSDGAGRRDNLSFKP